MIDYTPNASCIHGQDSKYSGVCNPIPLVSSDGAVGGDDSDFVHYRTEFVALGLSVLSLSGGLASNAPIVWGKEARTEVSG